MIVGGLLRHEVSNSKNSCLSPPEVGRISENVFKYMNMRLVRDLPSFYELQDSLSLSTSRIK